MATVLIVEHDLNNRRLLCQVLEMEGYRVFTAQHGGPGLHRMRKSRERMVVLLGLVMPYVDGLEVLSAVAADPVLAKRHHIIMMTGSQAATQGHVAELRQHLSVPLLAKPFSVDELLEAVEKAAHELT